MSVVTPPSAEYLQLINEFPLRPIETDEELAVATDVVNRLVDRKDLSEDEESYLEVLSDLIEAYESIYHPLTRISHGEMLRQMIAVRGLTNADVAQGAGIDPAAFDAILADERPLSESDIAGLATYFDVDVSAFTASAKD